MLKSTGAITLAALDYYLIAFALVCLLVALACGLAMPHARLWRWADPVYYPLAILGVILLFLSSERNRMLDDLRGEQARVLRELQEIERAKPSFTVNDVGTGMFKSSYSLLMVHAELGRACAYSSQLRCVSAREHETLIASAYRGYQPPATPGRDATTVAQIDDYCRRGYALIDALEAKSGLSSMVFGRLKASYTELTKRNLLPMDYGVTNLAEQTLRETLRRDEEAFLLQLPPDQRDSIRQLWDAHASFAGNLHNALSMCVRIPQVEIERLKTIQRWSEEQSGRVAARAQIEKRIEEAKRDQAPSTLQLILAFILGRLWPFVLVLALGLKFAKGIAALR